MDAALSSTPSLWTTHRMIQLDANIDDSTPEHLAVCVETLIKAGAADSWITPIVMKKGRPAHTLHCLCQKTEVDRFLELVFRHSTTLGVRVQEIDRVALRRRVLRVVNPFSSSAGTNSSSAATQTTDGIDVKLGYLGKELVSVKPELDHCKRVAISSNVPIQLVSER